MCGHHEREASDSLSSDLSGRQLEDGRLDLGDSQLIPVRPGGEVRGRGGYTLLVVTRLIMARKLVLVTRRAECGQRWHVPRAPGVHLRRLGERGGRLAGGRALAVGSAGAEGDVGSGVVVMVMLVVVWW